MVLYRKCLNRNDLLSIHRHESNLLTKKNYGKIRLFSKDNHLVALSARIIIWSPYQQGYLFGCHHVKYIYKYFVGWRSLLAISFFFLGGGVILFLTL